MEINQVYEIGQDEHGRFFRHFGCDRKSYNSNDIENRYCAVCHTFPDDAINKLPPSKTIVNHKHTSFFRTETWRGNTVTYSPWKCSDMDCGYEFGKEQTVEMERPFSILGEKAEKNKPTGK